MLARSRLPLAQHLARPSTAVLPAAASSRFLCTRCSASLAHVLCYPLQNCMLQPDKEAELKAECAKGGIVSFDFTTYKPGKPGEGGSFRAPSNAGISQRYKRELLVGGGLGRSPAVDALDGCWGCCRPCRAPSSCLPSLPACPCPQGGRRLVTMEVAPFIVPNGCGTGKKQRSAIDFDDGVAWVGGSRRCPACGGRPQPCAAAPATLQWPPRRRLRLAAPDAWLALLPLAGSLLAGAGGDRGRVCGAHPGRARRAGPADCHHRRADGAPGPRRSAEARLRAWAAGCGAAGCGAAGCLPQPIPPPRVPATLLQTASPR